MCCDSFYSNNCMRQLCSMFIECNIGAMHDQPMYACMADDTQHIDQGSMPHSWLYVVYECVRRMSRPMLQVACSWLYLYHASFISCYYLVFVAKTSYYDNNNLSNLRQCSLAVLNMYVLDS